MRHRTRLVLLTAGAALSCAMAASTARAGTRIERTLKLQPGGQFALETEGGSVTVSGGSASGARVVITSTRDDLESHYSFQFEGSGASARVTGKKKNRGLTSWFSWTRSPSLRYEVQVPSRTALDIDTSGGSIRVSRIEGQARLATSGGSIAVADQRGKLDAHTSGGSIHLERIRGTARVDTSGGGIDARHVTGPLDARTSGGSIEVEDVGGDLVARTSGGSITIAGAGGRVDAQTSGGSIQASFAPGNARGGVLETSAGGMRVALDPNVNLRVEASSSAGTVRSELPIRGTIGRAELRGTLGSGGELLRLHTSAGSISMTPLPMPAAVHSSKPARRAH